MPTTLAQAVTPNRGASNAADFQPPTQVPQTAPGELFPQAEGLQTGSQDRLLENSNARITVPTHTPAESATTVTPETNGAGGVIIAVLLAAVVLSFLAWRRRRQLDIAPMDLEVPGAAVEEVKQIVAKPPRPKPATKKPAPKKSKSQRKKKARR